MSTLPTPQTGERAVNRFVKFPTPASTAPLANGWPVGRTIMLADSNVSWLNLESCRHLVHSLGRVVPSFVDRPAMFAGVADLPDLSPSGQPSPWQSITWDRRSAARFGPFYGIVDVLTPDGAATIRPVRMHMDYTSNALTTQLFFAMTFSRSQFDLLQGSMIQLVSTVGTTGQHQFDATLIPAGSITSADYVTVRCRNFSGSGESSVVRVIQYWLWFGWFFGNSSPASCSINCFDAFETR